MTAFYLAARYIRREELVRYKEDLEAAGHTVTSRWLAGDHQWDSSGSVVRDYEAGGNPPDAVRFAQEDVEDLLAADVVLSFTETPRETFTADDFDDAFEATVRKSRVDRSREWRAVMAEELNRAAGRASRGGRHVEFGMALALGKRVIVVGPRENVFHLLPEVEVHVNWNDFVANHKRPW